MAEIQSMSIIIHSTNIPSVHEFEFILCAYACGCELAQPAKLPGEAVS